MTESNKQKAIEYCLNTFNFERVHKAMEQADWRWYTDTGYHIPTLVQLILAAQKRLNEAWDNESTVECGGLRAVYIPCEVNVDGKVEPPELELMFILAQTQSY